MPPVKIDSESGSKENASKALHTNQNYTLENTKWLMPLSEKCINYIEFKRDSIVIYDCEVGEKVYGVYEKNSSQITMQTTHGQYDDEFPSKSRHKHKPIHLNFELSENKLIDTTNNLTYLKQE